MVQFAAEAVLMGRQQAGHECPHLTESYGGMLEDLMAAVDLSEQHLDHRPQRGRFRPGEIEGEVERDGPVRLAAEEHRQLAGDQRVIEADAKRLGAIAVG
jgi:hypothetical protein